jgi:hypothetical protein
MGFIIRTDDDGSIVWDEPDEYGPIYEWVRRTDDGGFIAAANVHDRWDLEFTEIYIDKFDPEGNILWGTALGDYFTTGYWVFQILQSRDGGYVACGNKYWLSEPYEYHDAPWIAKFDDSGNLIWEKDFELPGFRGTANSSDQSNDGSYAASLYYYTPNNQAHTAHLLSISEDGNHIWEKVFDEEYFNFIRHTRDGGFIAVGSALLKMDATGKPEWQNTRLTGRQVEQVPSGGYAIVGSTNSIGASGYDLHLMRTNSDGELIWEKAFGGAYDDYGNAMDRTADGGYVLAGSSDFSGYGYSSANLVYYRREKDACCQIEAEDMDDYHGIAIEPCSEGGERVA